MSSMSERRREEMIRAAPSKEAKSASPSSRGSPKSSSVRSKCTARRYHNSSPVLASVPMDMPRVCCQTWQSSPEAFCNVRMQEYGAPHSYAKRSFASSTRQMSPADAAMMRPLLPNSAASRHSNLSSKPRDTPRMRTSSLASRAVGSSNVTAKPELATASRRSSWTSALLTTETSSAQSAWGKDSEVVARARPGCLDLARPSATQESAVVSRDHMDVGASPATFDAQHNDPALNIAIF
mmetsp:Transcript_12568/g.36100  ORF Transcript_12568/g.36100 Transcript_12568/m.36100 type:complete len:238 (+) Transcript_12568:262-975(+)